MPKATEEQASQQRIVASLASEWHMPIAAMAVLYEHERAALAQGARITQFLHIFATRKVRERLRALGRHWPASQPATPALRAA